MQVNHDEIDPLSALTSPFDHHSGEVRRASPDVEKANVLATRRLNHRKEVTGKSVLPAQELIDAP
jgi:hypothetical protein